MNNSLTHSSPKLFSHLYIEDRVLNHPETLRIRAKFDASKIIVIDHYKEVFNRSSQDFGAQSRSKKLILAHKEGKFIHEGSQYSDGFGFEQFFYASTLMGCLYDCDYCYLQGLYRSANTVLFVNLEDAFEELIPFLKKPTLVATSYDTDTMAVEKLTNQTLQWLEFANRYEMLSLEIRTKSANFKSLEGATPNKRVILAWTLSPQEIIDRYEHATPALSQRLKAAQSAIEAGWNVRLCVDPVIYTDEFKPLYGDLIQTIFQTIDPNKLHGFTFGSFRMSQTHLRSLKKLQRSDLAFYPYDVVDEMVTYPETIEKDILKFMLDKLSPYINDERIRTWQRQS